MTEADISKLMAQYPCTKLADGAIITCPARLSWINLDKPKGTKDRPDDLRYRATLLFPLNADLTVLRTAASEAAAALWGAKLQQVIASPKFNKPLLPQDTKAGTVDGYVAGAFRANVSTKKKPSIFDQNLAAIDPADAALVYPGMWARTKITVRAWEHDSGGRGVAFDLVSIQKIADDVSFGGSAVDAVDGFTAVAGAAIQNGAAGTAMKGKPASELV